LLAALDLAAFAAAAAARATALVAMHFAFHVLACATRISSLSLCHDILQNDLLTRRFFCSARSTVTPATCSCLPPYIAETLELSGSSVVCSSRAGESAAVSRMPLFEFGRWNHKAYVCVERRRRAANWI
jgi:hypothetical protein